MTGNPLCARDRSAAEREPLGKLNINLPDAAQLCGLVEHTVSGQWEPLDNETLEAVAGAARILLRDVLPSLEAIELLLIDQRRACRSGAEIDANAPPCGGRSRRKETANGRS